MKSAKNAENALHPDAIMPSYRRSIMLIVQCLVALVFAFASWALLAKLIVNLAGFYHAEQIALQHILAALLGTAEVSAATLLAAAWPLLVCVLAFLILVGWHTVIYRQGYIDWLDKEITRLSAICPLNFWSTTLSFSAWADCRAQLSALRTAYWGLMALLAAATVVVVINIWVLL